MLVEQAPFLTGVTCKPHHTLLKVLRRILKEEHADLCSTCKEKADYADRIVHLIESARSATIAGDIGVGRDLGEKREEL
jgi:hypothetical protein